MANSNASAKPLEQVETAPKPRHHKICYLEQEITSVERARTRITIAAWGIAIGVMIYGAINVTALLINHGIVWFAAPILPLMVDLAMCAGLWDDQIMHHHQRRAGWVTALRWITATMTLALNTTGPRPRPRETPSASASTPADPCSSSPSPKPPQPSNTTSPTSSPTSTNTTLLPASSGPRCPDRSLAYPHSSGWRLRIIFANHRNCRWLSHRSAAV
jgi:hypothetical protein